MNKILVALGLCTIPLFGFWTIPQNKQLKDARINIEKLQKETEDQKIKIKELKDLDTLLSDAKYDGVLERVPTRIEQETLILILDRIAQSTGFVFDSISFDRAQNPELEASTLNANFSIKGRQDKFSAFLKAIEKSPRFMGIESFSYNVENINGIDVISMSVPLYALSQSSEN